MHMIVLGVFYIPSRDGTDFCHQKSLMERIKPRWPGTVSLVVIMHQIWWVLTMWAGHDDRMNISLGRDKADGVTARSTYKSRSRFGCEVCLRQVQVSWSFFYFSQGAGFGLFRRWCQAIEAKARVYSGVCRRDFINSNGARLMLK